jgi:RNA polymerase sigma-70 factor, ECF subfamily
MNRPEALSLEALRAGDRAEFARLVDLYSNKIYYLALKILNSPQDAEDVLQETFIKALQSLPQFEGRSHISTWLYRIAVNEALMLVRKRDPEALSIEEPDETEIGDEAEPIQITDWCCLPEQELVSKEARAHLDQAITKLPALLRVVFVLRDIQGLSIKEAAEALGLTEVTVKTRLFRARMRLREDLSVYFRERVEEKSAK